LHAFGNILGQFGEGDGSGRTAEILSRDLPTPLAVPRPLKRDKIKLAAGAR